MQFLEVSKNCQVTWLESSTFWKINYFNFDLNVVVFMKKLVRGAILSQNHCRSQGVAEGTRALLIKMPPMTKICQKRLVSSFSVSFSILRWIYTVSVFRTFSSVFLRFCFSLTKYALFHPRFYKSIYAPSRLLRIDKNFVQKFCVWTIRAIFRNRAVPLYKKIFSENFCPLCDCMVSADMYT